MYKSPQSTNHNLILNVAMGFDRNVSPSRLIRTCLFSYNNAPRPHRVHRLTLSCNMLHATYIIDDLQMLSSPFKLASSRSHLLACFTQLEKVQTYGFRLHLLSVLHFANFLCCLCNGKKNWQQPIMCKSNARTCVVVTTNQGRYRPPNRNTDQPIKPFILNPLKRL